MDFALDLALYYADFGSLAARTPRGGSPEPEQKLVILDRGGQRFIGGDVVMSSPSIQVPVSSWPGLAKGDTLTIGTESWRLTETPQTNDTGDEFTAPVQLVRP